MIDVERVRKSFDGTRALDGFTLHVGGGELFGLVGPNGAGKTTLMKVLSTLLPPDSGRVQIHDIDVTSQPRRVKRLIGYMSDQPGVYQDMTVREFLEFFADAFGITGARHRAAVDRALQRSGLEGRSRHSFEQLSFGMKQRLVLAKTLLHDPKVLLLDEPATGLDPIARIELRAQLKQLQGDGITILISSHILSDLEDICTQIALIDCGHNAADAEGHSIIQLRAPQTPVRIYEIELLGDGAPAVNVVTSVPGTRLLESGPGRLAVEITGDAEQAAALLHALVVAGVSVIRFDHRAVGLEERYRLAFREKRP
ncbi:MAG TPA: ABC transporter ATP-binding protein [Terriglobales bacterium]|nr:ABC transporter ATP-binding protein [Terriglobales bacterium]